MAWLMLCILVVCALMIFADAAEQRAINRRELEEQSEERMRVYGRRNPWL